MPVRNLFLFASNKFIVSSFSYYYEVPSWTYWTTNSSTFYSILSIFFYDIFSIGVSSSRGSIKCSSKDCFRLFLFLFASSSFYIYSISKRSYSSSYENPWDSENSSSPLMKSIFFNVLVRYLIPACLQSVNFKTEDQMDPIKYLLPALANSKSSVL
jgi:hypothetical protein